MNALSILLTGTAVSVALIIALFLRSERHKRRDAERMVVDLRLRLASSLDALHAVQLGNDTLQAGVHEREATIAVLQTEKAHNATCIASLIRELNHVNARCADLAVRGKDAALPPYWLARLDDGTVVGPFSRC